MNQLIYRIIQKRFAEYPCLHRININSFLPSFRMKDYMTNYRNFDIPKLPVISYFLLVCQFQFIDQTGSFPIFSIM